MVLTGLDLLTLFPAVLLTLLDLPLLSMLQMMTRLGWDLWEPVLLQVSW